MIRLDEWVMPAASMGEMNPMPDIKNVNYIHAGYTTTENVTEEEKKYLGKGMIATMLPYQMQDGYDREKKPRAFKAAVVENEKLRAVFLPEAGGRLWSLYDKEKDRELLYVNSVFQPGNLGLRNAWFSGGVEFNVGIKGHNPLTCSPVWCAVDETKAGPVLRLYEYERIRGVVYSVSAWMPENEKVLYLKCRIENTQAREKHMYWWSNIAVPETKGTRILVPAREAFISFYHENHYVVDKTPIPMHEGGDVSYPGRIPSSRDFFYKIPKENPKWIAAVNEEGQGLLQCSSQRLFGRKLFVWGQNVGGQHWNEWLSEPGSSYIEIQAGLAHTQLEHIPMPGRAAWEWTEAYMPLEGEAQVFHGDYETAVAAAEQKMLERVGHPDKLCFPDDIAVKARTFLHEGSGWGALEESIRGEKISSFLSFPKREDPETGIWARLNGEGIFPAPSVLEPPISYVTGEFWLQALENLKEQNWFSLLHRGVILYARGDVAGAWQAFEASVQMEKSPWALRNLAMICKNEWGKPEKAREYMLEAFAMKKDCMALCRETAHMLTEDGGDALWLELEESLPEKMRKHGRLRFYRALALSHLGRLHEAAAMINRNFVMSDIKEGEISVSQLWFMIYRRLYAQETGAAYDEKNLELIRAADARYPLPRELDFRMHA